MQENVHHLVADSEQCLSDLGKACSNMAAGGYLKNVYEWIDEEVHNLVPVLAMDGHSKGVVCTLEEAVTQHQYLLIFYTG